MGAAGLIRQFLNFAAVSSVSPIASCGYSASSSALVTPWVTPQKATPAFFAASASVVLSPV